MNTIIPNDMPTLENVVLNASPVVHVFNAPPLSINVHIPIQVDVSHFRPSESKRMRRHKQRTPEFSQSDIYNNNPAPSRMLMCIANALCFTDSDGRVYWDGEDEHNAKNVEWIREYKESSMYDSSDRILLASSKRGDIDDRTFPEEGRFVFTTLVPPSSDSRHLLFNIASLVVHTSQYESSASARKTCYIVIRGGFTYI